MANSVVFLPFSSTVFELIVFLIVLKLLSPCQKPGRRYTTHTYRFSNMGSDCSDTSSPNSPVLTLDENLNLPTMPSWSQKHLSLSVNYIDILPDDISHTLSSSQDRAIVDHRQSHLLAPSPPLNDDGTIGLTLPPRPLRCIDPTITFRSLATISASSTFTVLSEGHTVHSEVVPLILRSSTRESPEVDGAYFYSTTLVPSYWRTISTSTSTPPDFPLYFTRD